MTTVMYSVLIHFKTQYNFCCPVFPLRPESLIDVWLIGETGWQKDKHVCGSNLSETSYI